ncbi:hypothetical protein LCGC14_2157910, partial [marine sediment metagenome]
MGAYPSVRGGGPGFDLNPAFPNTYGDSSPGIVLPHVSRKVGRMSAAAQPKVSRSNGVILMT